MMGLRLSEGIDLERFFDVTGIPVDDVLDHGALTRLSDGGLIERNARTLRATSDGRQRLNAVLAELLN